MTDPVNDSPVADTPEAIEARMRATRADLRRHVTSAGDGIAERTRHWPLWLASAVAVAGLGLGLARNATRPAPAPARRAPAAKATGVGLAALLGWAMRLAPLARGLLHSFRARTR